MICHTVSMLPKKTSISGQLKTFRECPSSSEDWTRQSVLPHAWSWSRCCFRLTYDVYVFKELEEATWPKSTGIRTEGINDNLLVFELIPPQIWVPYAPDVSENLHVFLYVFEIQWNVTTIYKYVTGENNALWPRQTRQMYLIGGCTCDLWWRHI